MRQGFYLPERAKKLVQSCYHATVCMGMIAFEFPWISYKAQLENRDPTSHRDSRHPSQSPTRTPTEPMRNSSVVPLYDQYLGPSATTQQVAFTVVPVPAPTATDSVPNHVIVDVMPQEVLDAAEAVKGKVSNAAQAQDGDCVGDGGVCKFGDLLKPWEKCCEPFICYILIGNTSGYCYKDMDNGWGDSD